MWREFWEEAKIPSSRYESVYLWAIIACGHFLLAAAIGPWLTGYEPIVIIGYFLTKELSDYRKGGRLFDGVVDTTFIGLGVYGYPTVAILLIALGITFYKHIQEI